MGYPVREFEKKPGGREEDQRRQEDRDEEESGPPLDARDLFDAGASSPPPEAGPSHSNFLYPSQINHDFCCTLVFPKHFREVKPKRLRVNCTLRFLLLPCTQLTHEI